VLGLDVVALRAAGEMDDDLGACHGGVDAVAGLEISARELDARALFSAPQPAAEDADRSTGLAQAGDDESADCACAAGDQNRLGGVIGGSHVHRVSPCHIRQ
jgi:hypothetical protein